MKIKPNIFHVDFAYFPYFMTIHARFLAKNLRLPTKVFFRLPFYDFSVCLQVFSVDIVKYGINITDRKRKFQTGKC